MSRLSPAISRRTFLHGAGITLALPFLEAMRPAIASAAGAVAKPRRMVCIETNMGILPQFFFPGKAGRDYELSPYLQRLAAHQDQMTVFSGVSHPGVTGAHAAEKCFLTGTPHPERGGFRNWVSLDQVAAEQIGNQTRYPSLALAVSNEGQTLSYTRSGGADLPPKRARRSCSKNSSCQASRRKSPRMSRRCARAGACSTSSAINRSA